MRFSLIGLLIGPDLHRFSVSTLLSRLARSDWTLEENEAPENVNPAHGRIGQHLYLWPPPVRLSAIRCAERCDTTAED
jgi:hypothetical protein